MPPVWIGNKAGNEKFVGLFDFEEHTYIVTTPGCRWFPDTAWPKRSALLHGRRKATYCPGVRRRYIPPRSRTPTSASPLTCPRLTSL
jgi:hypothetical protein